MVSFRTVFFYCVEDGLFVTSYICKFRGFYAISISITIPKSLNFASLETLFLSNDQLIFPSCKAVVFSYQLFTIKFFIFYR